MASFTQMKNAIYDAIYDETNIACYWDRQNNPIPDKPFFSLAFSGFRKIGRDVFIGPSALGTYEMIGNRNLTLAILGFGDGIIESTNDLQTIFERPDVHDTLYAAGVILYDIDQPILDISGIDISENEERSTYDVFIRTDSIVTDVPAGIIEKVNMEGTIQQPGKPDFTQTINVDSTI